MRWWMLPGVAAVGALWSLEAPADAAPSRIWSKAYTTWIHPEATQSKRRLGYVRIGDSVKLKTGTPIKGPGCATSFYEVEPYGFVCHDRTTALSLVGRYLKAIQLARGKRALMPFGYALSNGTPMYRRLPTPLEWARAERGYGPAGSFKPQSWGNRGHEKLAETRVVAPAGPRPWFLSGGGSAGSEKPLALVRRQIPHGSMLAYTKSFEHEGRSFLLSADGTVVPADRVRPFRESQFVGTELGRGVELPIAFFRERERPRYRRSIDGSITATGDSFAVRSFVQLDSTSEPFEHQGKRYLRLRSGDFTAETDATVIRQRDKLPFGVTESDKFILVSITQGTLVAYHGRRAAYATLASPGAGGVPRPGKDPVKTSTTPLGAYRITFKHVAATMSPETGENRKFWIADVPYTQYFNAPFALHTAYWHESFGEPMSAGCVNVSPRDGKWLFDWTDPQVPADWYGAAPVGPAGKGSFVIIAR
jgi:hypothetical protein